MKKLIRIVLAIQLALMLTHCASVSTDVLYKEYAVCREQTLHPKVGSNGIVMVHSNGDPVMVYATGACLNEMAAWEKSAVMREKRRREREAAMTSACPKGETNWCTVRGTIKNCGCVENSVVRDTLRRYGFY
ncbi:hypothetical protein LCGC14_2092800 [marine sediment metagenome]|uniref:Uncharacterized protein n=1 Tax=marine sediment metagenome TaxID=412755 RepID=A0A0F9EZK4_9ZZZZ